MLDNNFVSECAYVFGDFRAPVGARSFTRAAADPAGRFTRGASLIVILLSSLGLWAVIWAVVASFSQLG